MKYSALVLALLLAGCNGDVKPTPENIASQFKTAAEAALKKATPGDIRKGDFTITVYVADKPDPEDNLTTVFTYMCGEVAGRDGQGFRTELEPVVIEGVYSASEKELSKGIAPRVTLIDRISSPTKREFTRDTLDARCQGKPYSLGGISYTPHVIYVES